MYELQPVSLRGGKVVRFIVVINRIFLGYARVFLSASKLMVGDKTEVEKKSIAIIHRNNGIFQDKYTIF